MDESSEFGFTAREVRKAQAEALKEYKVDVRSVWECFTDTVERPFRQVDGYWYAEYIENFRQEQGKRLGAHLGAASKRARRDFARRLLEVAREQDSLDLTVVGARYVYEQATGFGPATPFLLANYGNKGRTASNKSELLDGEREELNTVAAAIRPHIQPLIDDMERIRAEVEQRTWEKVEARKRAAREMRDPRRGPVKRTRQGKNA